MLKQNIGLPACCGGHDDDALRRFQTCIVVAVVVVVAAVVVVDVVVVNVVVLNTDCPPYSMGSEENSVKVKVRPILAFSLLIKRPILFDVFLFLILFSVCILKLGISK